MRSHLPNSGQESGPSEQKKSVFDRLGRQLDTGRAMNRRSPYGDHLPPPPLPPMNESEFPGGRYARDQELEWRYQEERRHMQFGRNQPPPPPPPPMGPSHYPPEMAARQPQYYPPGPPPYSPGSMGHQMGPGGIGVPMGMHQRRMSPKYDRHGNLIRGPPMRMEHGMSPPRNFMPPGPMMHPAFDMPPMRPAVGGMYLHPRWQEPMDMNLVQPGMMPNDQFLDPNRYPSMPLQSPQQQQPVINPELEGPPSKHSFGAPRYTKWRERRDVITNLDRETAQSSSRTDSLKSSLQQIDNKPKKESKNTFKSGERSTSDSNTTTTKKSVKRELNQTDNLEGTTKKAKVTNKTSEPQDISDGEIVDDEDSSDETDDETARQNDSCDLRQRLPMARGRSDGQLQYHEQGKRRRLGEDYSMDYETISDEELEDFMSEKKALEDGKHLGDSHGKSSSEMELLNALGLDWANLVEMSKQSKKETTSSCSALRRFSLPNYLPTLGISSDLAGPEIYNILLKICH